MGEGVLKAMMIIALGMVAGAGLAGGLLGGIVTMGTGAPASITAPIGAVIGAGTAGTGRGGKTLLLTIRYKVRLKIARSKIDSIRLEMHVLHFLD